MQLRPPPGDESVMPLAKLIAQEIETQGPITFARFMELAIQHPEYGYYAASVERVGQSGDFLTAPETHPIFGQLLAHQIVECWTNLGEHAQLWIREFGAGRGTLASQIIKTIANQQPGGLETLVYELADLNTDHVEAVERRLGLPSSSIDVVVHAASDDGITGVVLANELLDAMPFHRIQKFRGKVQELRIGLANGWFGEIAGPLSPEVSSLESAFVNLSEGQIVEASPATAHWIEDLGNQLERGYAIIIDYGYERDVLHDAKRFPRGTLKTYRRHIVGEEPLNHIGNQDITAHVNFSVVEEAATEAGFDLLGITTLAEFCAGLGIDRILMQAQTEAESPADYFAARNAAMELLDPGGLGRFRVVVLSRGRLGDSRLKGLAFKLPGL
jgi:SAM-dependent MidA family methyltransferase